MVKKSKPSWRNLVQQSVSSITQGFAAVFIPQLDRETDILLDKVEYKLHVVQTKLINKMMASVIYLLAGVFLSLAVLFFLAESLGVPFTQAFLILGVVALAIGLFFSYKEQNKESAYYAK